MGTRQLIDVPLARVGVFAPRGRRGGFTLVEILVVLTIISLVIGGSIVAFGLVAGRGGADRDLERMQALLLLARERAELENRDYGVRLLEDGYEFLTFDTSQRRWVALDDGALARTEWSQALGVELDVEGRRVILRPRVSDVESLQPDFGVGADGEFTAFELRVHPAGRTSFSRLSPDLDGSLTLSPAGSP